SGERVTGGSGPARRDRLGSGSWLARGKAPGAPAPRKLPRQGQAPKQCDSCVLRSMVVKRATPAGCTNADGLLSEDSEEDQRWGSTGRRDFERGRRASLVRSAVAQEAHAQDRRGRHRRPSERRLVQALIGALAMRDAEIRVAPLIRRLVAGRALALGDRRRGRTRPRMALVRGKRALNEDHQQQKRGSGAA